MAILLTHFFVLAVIIVVFVVVTVPSWGLPNVSPLSSLTTYVKILPSLLSLRLCLAVCTESRTAFALFVFKGFCRRSFSGFHPPPAYQNHHIC
jgi:hypothetical protein